MNESNDLGVGRSSQRGLVWLAVCVLVGLVGVALLIGITRDDDARSACGIEALGQDLSKGSPAYEAYVNACAARR